MFVPQYPYPIVGGLERQAHELSKALGRKGVNVTVLSGKINGVGPANEVVEGVRVIRLSWSTVKWLRVLQTTIVLVWNMFRKRVDYDIVHLHNISWIGGLVVIIAKIFGKPVLVKLPNVGQSGIPGRKKNFLGQMLIKILKKADAFVALSEESANELRAINYPEGQILKITNGISNNIFGVNKTKVIKRRPFKIIFSGRLIKKKGILDLLAVWPRILRATSLPVVLEICGDGPQKQEIIQKMEELAIGETVILRGHINDIGNKLCDADIFVLPSYAEGNSNAILEAMLAGLPIVSTCVGGTALLVGKEASELLYEPGSLRTLEHLLIRLILDSELRDYIGKMMQKRIQTYFQIDIVADQYIQVYRHLIQHQSKRMVSSFSSTVFKKEKRT